MREEFRKAQSFNGTSSVACEDRGGVQGAFPGRFEQRTVLPLPPLDVLHVPHQEDLLLTCQSQYVSFLTDSIEGTTGQVETGGKF